MNWSRMLYFRNLEYVRVVDVSLLKLGMPFAATACLYSTPCGSEEDSPDSYNTFRRYILHLLTSHILGDGKHISCISRVACVSVGLTATILRHLLFLWRFEIHYYIQELFDVDIFNFFL